ncbi:MAG TPA: hypothetical protein DCZ23_07685 [Lachnospiraceae bacterium]|nr:hypothetical protein [Lachnospiraceae bacterium]
MPVIFICFIVFILWFRVKSKQAGKLSNNPREEFLKREQEANFTRKKDISGLNYITVSENALPFSETDDEDEAWLQNNVKNIISRKMLNLSGMTNTDIKLEYGHANLDILSEYDQNFSMFLTSLDRWGSYLYEKGDKKRSMQILEYAIDSGSDITGTFTTLARIYIDNSQPEKVQFLIDKAQNSDFFMKDTIVSKLVRLIQDFT